MQRKRNHYLVFIAQEICKILENRVTLLNSTLTLNYLLCYKNNIQYFNL